MKKMIGKLKRSIYDSSIFNITIESESNFSLTRYSKKILILRVTYDLILREITSIVIYCTCTKLCTTFMSMAQVCSPWIDVDYWKSSFIGYKSLHHNEGEVR